jgi:hypothetical protein
MKVKARDFDKKFDGGGDISKHLDVKKGKATRAGTETGERRLPCVDDTIIGQRGKTPGSPPPVDHQGLGSGATCKGVMIVSTFHSEGSGKKRPPLNSSL